MEKNRVCSHCNHLNYPKVEFCSKCGESISPNISSTNPTWVVIIYSIIDAIFWVVDEFDRWRKIGRLSIKIRAVREERAKILNDFEKLEKSGGNISLEEKRSLMRITEALSNLHSEKKIIQMSKIGTKIFIVLDVNSFLNPLYSILVLNIRYDGKIPKKNT